jgi:asparagine synthase (glutamine-hydrolysing)
LAQEYQFASTSDTEVLLAGFEKWGIGILDRIQGIFAFVLLDLTSAKMYLVRDRFGVKPLYYFRNGNVFGFASELRALLRHPKFNKEVDRSAVCDYFVYRYVPSPRTIWKDTYKIPPATYVEFDLQNGTFRSEEYWKLSAGDRSMPESQFLREFERLLESSVLANTVSDIPVGAFLSGGIDSSSIVYYLSKNGSLPETFSLGFKDWPESEHEYAQEVAAHFKLNNHVEMVDERSFDLLDRMAEVFDEPLADLSTMHTYQISALASKHLKGVMGGDGADEAMGGYGWYASLSNAFQNRNVWQRINPFDRFDLPSQYAVHLGMGVFNSTSLTDLLHPAMKSFISEDPYWFFRDHHLPDLPLVKAIQYLDIKTFLGEMVLTKVDRASMANSLEVRVPFLNHELFELIFSVAPSVYFKPDVPKYPLVRNVRSSIPKSVVKRKKQGFVGPPQFYADVDRYDRYLRNSLLVELGFVRAESIAEALRTENTWVLWKLLVLDRWANRWLK